MEGRALGLGEICRAKPGHRGDGCKMEAGRRMKELALLLTPRKRDPATGRPTPGQADVTEEDLSFMCVVYIRREGGEMRQQRQCRLKDDFFHALALPW